MTNCSNEVNGIALTLQTLQTEHQKELQIKTYVDLAGMKQCSTSSLLHHAFEDSVVSGVGRVGDVKVIAALGGESLHTKIKTGKHLSNCSRS